MSPLLHILNNHDSTNGCVISVSLSPIIYGCVAIFDPDKNRQVRNCQGRNQACVRSGSHLSNEIILYYMQSQALNDVPVIDTLEEGTRRWLAYN